MRVLATYPFEWRDFTRISINRCNILAHLSKMTQYPSSFFGGILMNIRCLSIHVKTCVDFEKCN